MMNKMTLFLCIAICLVLGTPGLSEAQKPCCTADQWEGVMVEVGGNAAQTHAGFFEGSIAVSYDMPGKRVASVSDLNYSAGAQSNMKVIQDFKGGMQYVIVNTTCTKSALNGTMPSNCIPDDAKNAWEMYVGNSMSDLFCDLWLYTYNGSSVELVVTRDTCTPVTETVYSSTDTEVKMTSIAYTSMTTGIKDTTVFIPPPSCDNVTYKHPHHQLQGLHQHAMNILRR